MVHNKILIGCSVCFVLVAGIVVWIFLALGSWTRDMSNRRVTKFRSPAVEGAEVWLLEEGFVDRGFSLFVVCPQRGESPIRVAELDWDGVCHLSSFQWTADGKVAVFAASAMSFPEAPTFAYDFQECVPILPPWLDVSSTKAVSAEDWKNFQQIIADVIRQHGGLRGEAVRVETIRRWSGE